MPPFINRVTKKNHVYTVLKRNREDSLERGYAVRRIIKRLRIVPVTTRISEIKKACQKACRSKRYLYEDKLKPLGQKVTSPAETLYFSVKDRATALSMGKTQSRVSAVRTSMLITLKDFLPQDSLICRATKPS
jgi:ACT domain-containing protein